MLFSNSWDQTVHPQAGPTIQMPILIAHLTNAHPPPLPAKRSPHQTRDTPPRPRFHVTPVKPKPVADSPNPCRSLGLRLSRTVADQGA